MLQRWICSGFPPAADPLRLGRTFSRVSDAPPLGDGFRLSGAGMTEEEGNGSYEGRVGWGEGRE